MKEQRRRLNPTALTCAVPLADMVPEALFLYDIPSQGSPSAPLREDIFENQSIMRCFYSVLQRHAAAWKSLIILSASSISDRTACSAAPSTTRTNSPRRRFLKMANCRRERTAERFLMDFRHFGKSETRLSPKVSSISLSVAMSLCGAS